MEHFFTRFISLFLLASALIVGLAMVALPYELGGVLLIGVALTFVAVATTRRLAPKEDRDFLPVLLGWALLAKVAATMVRLYINDVVYGGGDSNRIARAGNEIAGDIRSFDFSSFFSNLSPGTAFSESLTGLSVAFFGESFIGEFLIFSFLAFIGAVFFYRAFRIAIPEGNRKMLAVLILFYPALVYWPSGIGKDATVFFFLGLSVWGAMNFAVKSRLSGIIWASAGAAAVFYVRPEIGLIAAVATIIGLIVRSLLRGRQSLLMRLLTVALMGAAAGLLVNRGLAYAGVVDFSVEAALNAVVSQSSQVFDEGRQSSNFTPPEVMTPVWIPAAFVTVLFRPFVWEAHNLQALVQSIEGAMLGFLLLVMFPRLLYGLARQWNNPLVVYSIVFIVLGVIALSTLGNFGLLARQRAVILPFVFFIVAAAPVASARARQAAARVPKRRQLRTQSA
jgi:hypothetical protein